MTAPVEEIYLRELLMQCDYALLSVAQMNALLKEDRPEFFFREAQTFLSHAAAVSRILWPPRVKHAAKDQRAQARGRYLQSVLAIVDDHSLKKRTLRDHLEHFDERLDSWAQESTHGAFVDLSIGPIQKLVGGPAVGRGDFLRVFEPDRKVFTFRGDEFDIQDLVTGVESVRNAALARVVALRAAAVQPTIEANQSSPDH